MKAKPTQPEFLELNQSLRQHLAGERELERTKDLLLASWVVAFCGWVVVVLILILL